MLQLVIGRIRVCLATGMVAGVCLAARADEPLLGRWKAVDEGNSGAVTIIELYMDGGFMNGRVARVFDRYGNDINPVCERCFGELQNRPLIGATFIRGLRFNGAKWVDGKVIDLRPGLTQGVEASCEIEMVGSKAKLFGYRWRWAREWLNGQAFWEREGPP
jgi:hypothetical protein